MNLSELDIYSTAASVRNRFNDELSILCSLTDAMENHRQEELASWKALLKYNSFLLYCFSIQVYFGTFLFVSLSGLLH